MRLASLGLAVALLTACGELQGGALSGGRSSPSPAATATATPAIAARLMEQVKSMTGLIRRVDRITATRVQWGEILARGGRQQPGADPNEDTLRGPVDSSVVLS